MYDEALAHHGIKGQRWGIRRFQNEDGTRTPAGRKRYNTDSYVPTLRTESKMPKGTISEDWGKRETKIPGTVMSIAGSRDSKKKEKLVNKAVESAKKDQKYWEDLAEQSKKYIKSLESGSRDSDFNSKEERDAAIKIEKSEQRKYQNHAKEWVKAQDQLLKMDISNLSVKEVKKKTNRTSVIRDMT